MEKTNGSIFWVEDSNDQTPIPTKHKRKVKAKTEFIGWGSKSLIEFLQSIGKNTDEQLTERDVTTIIINYVQSLNLYHPIKKKKVVCDERLRVLFGKKLVTRIKIQDLLKSHFADNHESSEDDYLYSSDEYEGTDVKSKKQKVVDSEKNEKEKAPSQKKKPPVSRFAAIVPENIKLLYLKKSLLQELVKNPEEFEGKVVGSYIRIKTDPNDYTQKNSHQVVPVTGVKWENGKTDVKDVLLEVPNMMDIPINLLSDFDFSKEECEDLSQKVKDGLLKRPTVVEFEQKVQILHEDITNHWLPRELTYLQNLIDRANEKGWRKDITLHEYLVRKALLETPSEKSKLLTEIPKVTPDVLTPEEEATLQQEDEQDNIQQIHTPNAAEQAVDLVGANEGKQQPVENGGSKVISHVKTVEKTIGFEWVESVKTSNNVGGVIELSDSDDEDDNNNKSKTNEKLEEKEKYDVSIQQWYYLDPHGKVQGPFSGVELKCWSEAGYFDPDFKVWKNGQVPESAVLLTDMLSGRF